MLNSQKVRLSMISALSLLTNMESLCGVTTLMVSMVPLPSAPAGAAPTPSTVSRRRQLPPPSHLLLSGTTMVKERAPMCSRHSGYRNTTLSQHCIVHHMFLADTRGGREGGCVAYVKFGRRGGSVLMG